MKRLILLALAIFFVALPSLAHGTVISRMDRVNFAIASGNYSSAFRVYHWFLDKCLAENESVSSCLPQYRFLAELARLAGNFKTSESYSVLIISNCQIDACYNDVISAKLNLAAILIEEGKAADAKRFMQESGLWDGERVKLQSHLGIVRLMRYRLEIDTPVLRTFNSIAAFANLSSQFKDEVYNDIIKKCEGFAKVYLDNAARHGLPRDRSHAMQEFRDIFILKEGVLLNYRYKLTAYANLIDSALKDGDVSSARSVLDTLKREAECLYADYHPAHFLIAIADLKIDQAGVGDQKIHDAFAAVFLRADKLSYSMDALTGFLEIDDILSIDIDNRSRRLALLRRASVMVLQAEAYASNADRGEPTKRSSSIFKRSVAVAWSLAAD